MAECQLCGEEEAEPFTTVGLVGAEYGIDASVAHPECMLRAVFGGIGHLIAHNYWCVQKSDPDAGLTYRQSAKMALEYVHVVGNQHTEEPV